MEHTAAALPNFGDEKFVKGLRREVNRLAQTCQQFNVNVSQDAMRLNEDIVDTLMTKAQEYALLLQAVNDPLKNGPYVDKLATSIQSLLRLKEQCLEASKENATLTDEPRRSADSLQCSSTSNSSSRLSDSAEHQRKSSSSDLSQVTSTSNSNGFPSSDNVRFRNNKVY